MIKKNLLFCLTLFLFFFIPLYPKIPLADIIPGYLVRVRLEDLFLFITGLIWLYYWIKKKITWRNSIFWLIVAYLSLGAVSLLISIFLLQRIPLELLHIGKSGLHLFRYAEYFSLFAVAFAALKNIKDLKFIKLALPILVILISLYGLGQKYAHFPVFSTMNREFSKGAAMQLGEGARVNSTFGGHYDMSAWLVLILPILLALALKEKGWLFRVSCVLAQVLGLYLLYLGEAKTSILALLLAYLVLIYLFLLKSKLIGAKFLKYIFGFAIATYVLATIIFLAGGPWRDLLITQAERINGVKTITAKLNISPVNLSRPGDLQGDGYMLVKKEKTNEDSSVSVDWIKEKQSWSDNALKYGITMGIRFDTLWPQAIRGFIKNIFTGSGYATLNKQENQQFVEADSTDNNYLRILGETGFSGLFLYLAILWFILKNNWLNYLKNSNLSSILSWGFLAGTAGLLLNAVLIDVFASSKVAFTFYLLAGLTVKSFYLKNTDLAEKLDRDLVTKIKKIFSSHWPLLLNLAILSLLLYRNPYLEEKSLILKINPDTSSTWKYLSLLSFLPIIGQHPFNFYFLNLIVCYLLVLIIYLLLKKSQINFKQQFYFLLLIILLPPWRQAVYNFNLNLLFYFLLCLVLIAVNYFSKNKYFKYCLGILLVINIFSWVIIPDPLLKNYRENVSQTWHYRTVRRANAIFNPPVYSQVKLVSKVNPDFAQFFQKNYYQLQDYQKFLLQDKQPPIYLTDYKFDHNDQQSFYQLRQNYQTKILDLDCQEHCNFYELTAKKPLSKILAPEIYNQQQLDIADPANFSFLFFGHSYHYPKPASEEKDLYYEMQLGNRILPAASNASNFWVMAGQLVKIVESSSFTYFNTYLADLLPVPLINVDKKLTHFIVGQNYFLNINLSQPLDNPSKIFIYEKLLEIENHDVSNLFIFSHQAPNEDFNNFILLKLKELKNVNIYIISGNNAETQQSYEEKREDNITYLKTGFGREQAPELIKFTINNNQVNFAKFNL